MRASPLPSVQPRPASEPGPAALIQARDLRKDYPLAGSEPLAVLHGLTFSIEAGDFIAIMGPSGSGKSTLMNILGCLDVPSSGHYLINATDTAGLDPDPPGSGGRSGRRSPSAF